VLQIHIKFCHQRTSSRSIGSSFCKQNYDTFPCKTTLKNVRFINVVTNDDRNYSLSFREGSVPTANVNCVHYPLYRLRIELHQ